MSLALGLHPRPVSVLQAARPALQQRQAAAAAPAAGAPAAVWRHGGVRRGPAPLRSSDAAAMPAPEGGSNGASQPSAAAPDASSNGAGSAPAAAASRGGLWGWVRAQRERSAELRKKLASLGLAAVLAYGLFDGVSYTIAFSLAFLGYEARTGLNPTQNVADIVKICVLMWAGNNVTRPFRLAGAAALAPFMDRLMERLQAKLKLRSKGAAFAICVAVVASVCFTCLGALFFSRWVQG